MSSSADEKRRKVALPSVLSNIRNAQAVIGRAAAAETNDLFERETRPLVGSGPPSGGSSVGIGGRTPPPSSRPHLRGGAPSSSFSVSSLQNFTQRIGSQWRKRSRRKQGQGVTVVPQTFYLAVGCFFFAFPLFFVLYILARHAVFGDEADVSSVQAHVHEVPAHPSVEVGTDQTLVNGAVEMHLQVNEVPGTEDGTVENGGMNDGADQADEGTSDQGQDLKDATNEIVNDAAEVGETNVQKAADEGGEINTAENEGGVPKQDEAKATDNELDPAGDKTEDAEGASGTSEGEEPVKDEAEGKKGNLRRQRR